MQSANARDPHLRRAHISSAILQQSQTPAGCHVYSFRYRHFLFCFSAGRRPNIDRNAADSRPPSAEKQKENRWVGNFSYKHGTPTGFWDRWEELRELSRSSVLNQFP